MEDAALNSDNTRILVCCHAPCELPNDTAGVLMPIFCGAALSSSDLPGVKYRDDSVNGEPCDNISSKNKSFCELTAVYWAWKNMKKVCPNIKYIGLNHYRRYFAFKERNPWYHFIKRPVQEIKDYRVDLAKLQKILSKNDGVVSMYSVIPYSVRVYFLCWSNRTDVQICQKIVDDLAPSFSKDFDILLWGNEASLCNVFVFRWDYFVSYCEWLFPILFEAERRINVTYRTTQQARVFGYLGELLLNVYAIHNSVRLKRLNVLSYRDDESSNSISRNFLWWLRVQLAFVLSKENISMMHAIRYLGGKVLRIVGLKH